MGTDRFDFCFSSDSKYLVTSSSEGNNTGLTVHDLDKFEAKKIYTYHGVRRSGSHVNISKDNNCIATQFAGNLILYKANWNQTGIIESGEDRSNLIYPNPTTNKASFAFTIHKDDIYKIAICDINGNEIRVIQNGYLASGEQDIEVDCSSLASGNYFVKVSSSTFSNTFELLKVQ